MSIVSESFQVVKQLLISKVEKGWFEQNFPGRQLWAAMGLAREGFDQGVQWREGGRKEPCANINCEAASPWCASLLRTCLENGQSKSKEF